MKKIFIGILVIISFILIGCSNEEDLDVPILKDEIVVVDKLTFLCSYESNTASLTKGKFDSDEFEKVVIPSSITHNNIEFNVTSISDEAFAYQNISSVTIPDGVISIGYKSFYNCIYLSNISSSKYLETIKASAFENCVLLSYFSFTENITYIGQSAFENCRSLERVVLPNITQINHRTFYGCRNITYLELPQTLTQIDNYAFYECKQLSSITLPDSMKSIGSYVFLECLSLKKIVIPKGVYTIGKNVFYEDIDIYCETNEKPDTWDSEWTNNKNIVWGY